MSKNQRTTISLKKLLNNFIAGNCRWLKNRLVEQFLGLKRRDKVKSVPQSQSNSSTLSTSICTELPGTSQLTPGIKGINAKRAIVKKRKRKISESDSLASSEASGKPYKTILLPEVNSTNQRPLSTVDLSALQRSISPEYQQKMKEWDNSKRISVKGQQIKNAWLRKPSKQPKTESCQSPMRYFERSEEDLQNPCNKSSFAGRQATVIYNEPESLPSIASNVSQSVSHAASESNIKDLQADKQLAKLLPKGNSSSVSHEIQFQRGGIRTRSTKSRYVTFTEEAHEGEEVEQIDQSKDGLSHARFPSSVADSANSLGASNLTFSEESVFSSEELIDADMNNTGILDHLVALQQKNSVLLRRLRDKSREYDQITNQLSSLEKEIKVLKGRYKLDSDIEKIANQHAGPNLVPASLLGGLENKIRQLDEELRQLKTDNFRIQQESLESHSKDDVTYQKYLDKIEKLQKINFQLLQKQMSDLSVYDTQLGHNMELLPTYEALYSFAVSLLRKVRQLRSQLMEKAAGSSRLDLELLQTQSSLLVAHAHIERQKLELRTLGYRLPRRRHSYHGEDLLIRIVNTDLSFFLPFKLHGSRLNKYGEVLYSTEEEEALENEFLQLFNCSRKHSGVYEDLEMPLRDLQSQLSRQTQMRVPGATSRMPLPPLTRPLVRPLLSSIYALPSIRQGFPSDWPRPTTRRPLSWADMNTPIPATPPPIRKLPEIPVSVCEVRRVSTPAESPRRGQSGMGRRQISADQADLHREPVEKRRVKVPPAPLRLGNVGQVRAIAAAFDLDVNSAPNTPLSKTAPHLLQPQDQDMPNDSSVPTSPILSKRPLPLYMTNQQLDSHHLQPPTVLSDSHQMTSHHSDSHHYDTPASSFYNSSQSSSGGGTQYGLFRLAGSAQSPDDVKVTSQSASREIHHSPSRYRDNSQSGHVQSDLREPSQSATSGHQAGQSAISSHQAGHSGVSPYHLTRIPIKPTSVQSPVLQKRVLQQPKILGSPTPFRRDSEQHYETLTLPSQQRLPASKISTRPDLDQKIDKSTTPESTSSSSGGSAGDRVPSSGLARLNETKRRQFLYGAGNQDRPDSRPAPRQSSVRDQSRPGLVAGQTRLAKLPQQQPATQASKPLVLQMRSKGSEIPKPKSGAPPQAEKKRTSWIMKLKPKK